VKVRGYGQTVKTNAGGYADLLPTGASRSGSDAYAQANVRAKDIKYASIYDNFTISVILQLEELGFCSMGAGGRFVADGNLISGVGSLAVNTDGGGLCNNHPANRGGMTKVLEAMRQLRGEAHQEVQVPNCDLALACGPGSVLAGANSHATVILERL
jgi:acetyl-CoA C-acetyltransferase